MSKKIAFVSPMFTGSILPLIKHFIGRGYYVDLYIITLDNIISNPEGWDCEIHVPKIGYNKISKEDFGSVSSYLNIEKFSLYALKMLHPYATIPVLRNAVELFSYIYLRNTARYMNRQGYCFVNFVGLYTNYYFIPLIKKINSKVLVTLHEVCNHSAPDFKNPSKLVSFLIKNSIDVIVPSEKSYNDMMCYDNIIERNLHIIKFGLFESYQTVQEDLSLNFPDNYLLYIGNINKYKGIDILADAIGKSKLDIRIIIAGRGNDESIQLLEKDKRVTLINRYLTNGEFVYLIKNCRAIVCPYRSSSQSGIPQVAFIYNKTIIASNIPYWKSVLQDGNLGALFESENSTNLERLINVLMSEDETIKKYAAKINIFKKQKNDSNWDCIVDLYINKFINS